MSKANFKGTIEQADRKITFEGPKEFVEEQVARFVSGSVISKSQVKQDSTGNLIDGTAVPSCGEHELIAAKSPRGHHEIIAVLAFALKEAGSEEFTEGDINRAYVRAKVRPPKVVAQAIRDAKNKFDFIESGSKRGLYRLTTHGDRTVRFDLPRT
jgi:hypothetical protein